MQRQCNSTDNTGHAASVSDSVGQRHKPQHSKKSLEAKDVSLYKPFRAEYSELWIDDGIGIHCGHSYCIPSNKQSRTWHRCAADACNNNAHMRPCRFISALHFCYLFPQWNLGKHCWRQLQCFQKRRIGILRRTHRRRAFRLDIPARKKSQLLWIRGCYCSRNSACPRHWANRLFPCRMLLRAHSWHSDFRILPQSDRRCTCRCSCFSDPACRIRM